MSQQQHASAGDFNGLAADYERYRVGYSSELFDVLAGLGISRGARVLDAGCGTGIAMAPLVARGIEVTGVDPSAEMLAAAAASVPAAALVAGRAEALPFADNAFDGAVSAQAFHWFDADRAFAELIRVVKLGGPIAVWWKVLGSESALRALRAAAAERAGLTPLRDSLAGGFGAFYRAPFAKRVLRVLPFSTRLGIEDWLGYERSRASVRNAYGARRDAYFDALRVALTAKYGSADARIDVPYTQFLYVGNSAS